MLGKPAYLVISLLGCTFSGWAQRPTESMYTSPGTPLIVHKPVTPYNSNTYRALALFPRYWQTADSAKQLAEYRAFLHSVSGRIRLPDAFVYQNIKTYESLASYARFVFQLIIKPDGTLAATLVSKEFSKDGSEYSAESVRLLEQSTIRTLGTLRFAAAATQDTLFLPVNFGLPR
ncbi:hypothetical protein FY528_01375 [Hymenobacter lutimineralis]|uniref:TonB C-terminal domain-containing protein n=1 Tax=Hymenobacter lutimineralis TaxID=2606448 RepID=A0A5D6VI60_9BACT|nr:MULTISPECIES: hypothetical protein [Hymenobacter]QIX60170.1 hypothetical protein HER32_02790 [Hymenobacter sp. BT18]TYZ14408.1 hypothetical protein FY528_01375 [Hymenobacter lutimineralis]